MELTRKRYHEEHALQRALDFAHTTMSELAQSQAQSYMCRVNVQILEMILGFPLELAGAEATLRRQMIKKEHDYARRLAKLTHRARDDPSFWRAHRELLHAGWCRHPEHSHTDPEESKTCAREQKAIEMFERAEEMHYTYAFNTEDLRLSEELEAQLQSILAEEGSTDAASEASELSEDPSLQELYTLYLEAQTELERVDSSESRRRAFELTKRLSHWILERTQGPTPAELSRVKTVEQFVDLTRPLDTDQGDYGHDLFEVEALRTRLPRRVVAVSNATSDDVLYNLLRRLKFDVCPRLRALTSAHERVMERHVFGAQGKLAQNREENEPRLSDMWALRMMESRLQRGESMQAAKEESSARGDVSVEDIETQAGERELFQEATDFFLLEAPASLETEDTGIFDARERFKQAKQSGDGDEIARRRFELIELMRTLGESDGTRRRPPAAPPDAPVSCFQYD
ncbi:MAG: hypothetical protein MHM6MM_007915 [Cercozoa sp. M6MM]